MPGRLASGLVLAVIAALAIALSDPLSLDLQHVAVLGVALGGAVALVPHPHEWGRLAGFLLGFGTAWVVYALRAAVLPDASAGRAVGAALLIGVVAVVAAVSSDRIPLWSSLIGAAALVGAYEETYTNAPSQFVTESTEAATAILLAAALGYLAASLVPLLRGAPARRGAHASGPDRQQTRGADHGEPGGVESLMTGESK